MSRPRLVFRKRVKLFGPLHLNVSLHHVGLGVHVPGASFSINDAGRRQASIGLPGSGLRVQQVWSGKVSNRPTPSGSAARFNPWPLAIGALILAALLLAALR
jgi:hypothetical protein